MYKISVIVPVYKAETTLCRCVDSILSQTYRDLEVILVDDGSPDSSGAICDAFAEADSRVRVIHQKNRGVAAARNSGLDLASGDYITFVDSDDYIDKTMYLSMMNIVDEYECDVVLCDCIKEFEDHTELYSHDIRPGYYSREDLEREYFPHLLMMPSVEYPPTISNWCCLFRQRQFAGQTGSAEENDVEKDRLRLRYVEGVRYSEDLLFGAQMMYHAHSFYYMKESAFYHYDCTNEMSATHTFVPDKWQDYKKLYKYIIKYFGKCEEYDFGSQIDKILLFFVYNTTVEIMTVGIEDSVRNVRAILDDPDVREMFKRVKVLRLPISRNLKIWTICYKYRICIKMLCAYMKRKTKTV